jgi:hypothetical protein
MYIILAISLLATFRPPYFERSLYGMGIRIARRIEGLKWEEKGIICNRLIFNGL